MFYEWHKNKCKHEIVMSDVIDPEYYFLQLSPLFELINLFVSFKDTDGNITSMHKKPYLETDGVKAQIHENNNIYIIDLFIYTNNLKLLFDTIKTVIDIKEDTLSEDKIKNMILSEFKEDNKITNFFTDKDINNVNLNYLCNIIFLIRESIRGIKLYDFSEKNTDTSNFPLYIIGNYILHRIKDINDKINKKILFNNFRIVNPHYNKNNNITELIKLIFSSRFINGNLRIDHKKDGNTLGNYAICVEATIYNIFFFLFYNSSTDKIDVSNLENINIDVKRFFDKYLCFQITTDIKIISEWVRLLTNHSYILYDNYKDNEKYEVSGLSITDLLNKLIDQDSINSSTVTNGDIKRVFNGMINLLIKYTNGKNIEYKNNDNKTISITTNDKIYNLLINKKHCELSEENDQFSMITPKDLECRLWKQVIGNNIKDGCTFIFNGPLDKDITHITREMGILYKGSKINIPKDSKLKIIGKYAFLRAMLTSFELPNSVISIEESAFFNCSRLINFKINMKESMLMIIGNDAFYSASSLISFELPNNVTSIGSSAFYDCKQLINFKTNVNDSRLLTIYNGAFSYSGLISFELPNSVTSIGRGAFDFCRKLINFKTNVKDSNLMIIDSNAFRYSGLISFELPNRVTSIGENAFSNCANLEKFIISEGSHLSNIGQNAFSDYENLTIYIHTTLYKNIIKMLPLDIKCVEIFGDNTNLSENEKKDDTGIELPISGGSRKTYWKTQMNINKLKYINLTSKK